MKHTRVLLFLMFVVGGVVTAPGQANDGLGSDMGDAGTGGRNTIQGRIYLPSGRRLDRRIRVRLSSVRGGESSTMSDDNGSFAFRRLAGGTYQVTIEGGREFEPAGETVDILEPSARERRDQPGQSVTIQIQLAFKRESVSKPSVVNAEIAAIPERARELYENALQSAREGDHKKAIQLLKDAVALHPEFPLAFNELGAQYQILGHFAESAEAFRTGIKLAPDVFILRLNYGVVLVQQKKFAEAEVQLRLALENDDTSGWAHLYRGRALIGLKREEDAESELKTALKLGGDDLRIAHRYLGAIYNQRGEDERAIEALETYLRLEPNAKDRDQIRMIIADLRRHEKKSKYRSSPSG